MRRTIYCLHGNLQLPSVWDALRGSFEETFGPMLRLEPWDIWHTLADGSDGLWPWADAFCTSIGERAVEEDALLLGYSMGGRLALHAILQRPDLWHAAVIVGANLGIEDQDARDARYQQDLKLGDRFVAEPWETLMAQWDANPVFCGRPFTGERQEKKFSRENIRRIFDVFSVGQQEYLLPRFADMVSPPILYISGEEDHTYSVLGERFAATCPAVTHRVIAKAGHRVPWENPEAFCQVVFPFLA